MGVKERLREYIKTLNVAGNGNQVTTNDIAGLIELQKGYQEMIKEKDSQIARLISVIEKLSEK